MSSPEIRLLLTSVGGSTTPGIVESLRKIKEYSFYIVGVDMEDDAIGFAFVDKGYTVPPGDSAQYLPQIWKIIERERLDVVLPRSDEEMLTISQAQMEFKAMGTAVVCSDYQSVLTASDKGSMLTFLQSKGIITPEFYLPSNTKDLQEYVHLLGYPARPVIVKPRRSRGGRGMVIVEPNPDILAERQFQRMPLEFLVQALNSYTPFPSVIAMEYLPGTDYSVDVLADKGRALIVVPRTRLRSLGGMSQVGEIIPDPEVSSMVNTVVEAFGFHTNVNVQLRRSDQGVPLVYEINPRTSGTVAATAASGHNLIYYGINLALGRPINKIGALRTLRMTRYMKEHYVYGDIHFSGTPQLDKG